MRIGVRMRVIGQAAASLTAAAVALTLAVDSSATTTSPSTTTSTATPVTTAPARVEPGCAGPSGAISAAGIGPVRLGLTRPQANRAGVVVAGRGGPTQIVFCVSGNDTRAGIATPAVLRRLGLPRTSRYDHRVVWVLTANPAYGFHGLRADETVAHARSSLRLNRPLGVGANSWYLVPDGGVTVMLKVRRGLIEELGVADRGLTTGDRRYLGTFLRAF